MDKVSPMSRAVTSTGHERVQTARSHPDTGHVGHDDGHDALVALTSKASGVSEGKMDGLCMVNLWIIYESIDNLWIICE